MQRFDSGFGPAEQDLLFSSPGEGDGSAASDVSGEQKDLASVKKGVRPSLFIWCTEYDYLCVINVC